jgi:hypothetical protein
LRLLQPRGRIAEPDQDLHALKKEGHSDIAKHRLRDVVEDFLISMTLPLKPVEFLRRNLLWRKLLTLHFPLDKLQRIALEVVYSARHLIIEPHRVGHPHRRNHTTVHLRETPWGQSRCGRDENNMSRCVSKSTTDKQPPTQPTHLPPEGQDQRKTHSSIIPDGTNG